MRNWISNLLRKPTLASFDSALTRERLIQSSRIVVIDDEMPLLIEELRKVGFAVDHDQNGNDLKNYDNQIYDVAIIDYHGVGQGLGKNQGLDLVKYIKRVSPRTRIIAYTSRSLSAAESEFFRLSHVVLPKDFGLGDSLRLVEDELRKAFEKSYLLDALLLKLSLVDGSERERMQGELIKALSKKNEGRFREYVGKVVGKAAEKSVELIISKMF
jgi:DNA-binding NtrC family response regulator